MTGVRRWWRNPWAARGADRGRPGAPERGSVAIEVAVLAPAFIALMVLAGVAGRTALAQEAVQ